MDGMMEQLLSKDLMYEPMKQVTEKFPEWLQAQKGQLSQDEWEQRNLQYQCFQQLVKVYEEEEDESNKNSNNKMGRLLELMQKVQEYGQPPAEIIKDIAPGLELDEEGMPKNIVEGALPFLGSAGAVANGEECPVM
mmetsp:Transcript_33787/g.56490  ORF Transcript_33787/g.56490 Transcript_33787/m.56490 type:complete len:136 (-) Transcript_33787:52-459(-)